MFVLIRQLFCSHYSKSYDKEVGPNYCIVKDVVCNDCGKALPPSMIVTHRPKRRKMAGTTMATQAALDKAQALRERLVAEVERGSASDA